MRLHLGVMDDPYKEGNTAKTTGKVAGYLEDRYHVMEVFYETHVEKIGEWLTEAISDEVEAIMNGVAPKPDPFYDANKKIESRFKEFLYLREMDGLGVPGVPTRAAKMGVDHRLAKPYAKKNPERPSFIDTGTYESHFFVWTEK
jgi:hypothetical protein